MIVTDPVRRSRLGAKTLGAFLASGFAVSVVVLPVQGPLRQKPDVEGPVRPTSGRFTRLEGRVLVRPIGRLDWIPATLATELRRNDLVRTDASGRAEIEQPGEGGTFTIEPDGLVSIQDQEATPRSDGRATTLTVTVSGCYLPYRVPKRPKAIKAR